MERRVQDIAAAVGKTIAANDVPKEIVAQAADLSTSDLELRLTGAIPFELTELAEVGGLLHVPVAHFLEGVA